MTLKLTYFDMHGGRGEPARLAMAIGNIDFEDERISFQTFGQNKESFPFGRIPVLEVDGEVVSQSNSINRYVGKLAGLYPEDPREALYCDEAMASVEDIIAQAVSTFSITDEDEKKKARIALAEGPLTFYLERFEALLERRGGEYFAAGRLTVADLKVFVWIRTLQKGVMDHIPTDLAEKCAPNVVAHCAAIGARKDVKAYYASFES